MLLATTFVLSFGVTAFAGSWQSNATGWWWQEDDGTWPANCWKWIDDNGDGVSEMYYFDANGYRLANTIAPDGKYVNANGQWETEGYVHHDDGGVPEMLVNGVYYGLDMIGENAITTFNYYIFTGCYDQSGYEGLMEDARSFVVDYPKAVQERWYYEITRSWNLRQTNGLWPKELW